MPMSNRQQRKEEGELDSVILEGDDSITADFINDNVNWEEVQKQKEAAAGFNYGYFRHIVNQFFGAGTYIFIALITIFTPVAWVIISQYLAQVNISSQSWTFDNVSISRINGTHYDFSADLRLSGASFFDFEYPTSNVSLLVNEDDGEEVLGFIEIPGMQVDSVRPFTKRMTTILEVADSSMMEAELRAVTSGRDTNWYISGELKTIVDLAISLRTFVTLHSPVSVPSVTYDNIVASNTEVTKMDDSVIEGSFTVGWDNLSNTSLIKVYKNTQMIFVPDVDLSGNSVASQSILLTCDAIDLEAYHGDANGVTSCTFNVVHTKDSAVTDASQLLDSETKYALASRLLEKLILRGGLEGTLRGPLPVPATNPYVDTNDSRIPEFVPIMGRMSMWMGDSQLSPTDDDIVTVASRNIEITLNPGNGSADITLNGSSILQNIPGIVTSSSSMRLVDHTGKRGIAFTSPAATDEGKEVLRCPAPPAYLSVKPAEDHASTNVPVPLSVEDPTSGVMDVPDGCKDAYRDALCCGLIPRPSMAGKLNIEFPEIMVTLNYDPNSQVSIRCKTDADYETTVCSRFTRSCDAFIGEYCDE
eukprot:Clim_evm158s210 gene=Clim_evmTU158s210